MRRDAREQLIEVVHLGRRRRRRRTRGEGGVPLMSREGEPGEIRASRASSLQEMSRSSRSAHTGAGLSVTRGGIEAALPAELERCEWIAQGEPVVLLRDSGTGKSHLLIGLDMVACQRGLRVRYTTAAALVGPDQPIIPTQHHHLRGHDRRTSRGPPSP